MATNSWTVVQFVDDRSYAAVPSTWIQGNVCHIPILTKEELDKCIKRCEPVNKSWATHEIKGFRNKTYAIYEVANSAVKYMEKNDSSLGVGTMKRKTNQDVLSSIGDERQFEEDVLPPPPKICKFKEGEKQNQKKSPFPDTYSNLSQPGPSGIISGYKPPAQNTKYQNKDQNRIDKLEKRIAEIHSSMKNIEKELFESTRHSYANKYSFWNDNALRFPIEDEIYFYKFEQFLNNAKQMNNVSFQLAKLGGYDTKDFIRKALDRILGVEYAMNFNWSGRGDKVAFNDTNTCDVLKKAAKIFGSRSVKDTEIAIQQWLEG